MPGFFILIASALLALTGVLSSSASAQDLLQAYAEAKKNAPELKAIEAGFSATQYQEKQARAQLFPSILFNGSLARDRQKTLSSDSLFFSSGTSYFTTQNAALRASQPLYHPENRLRLDIAKHATESHRLQLKKTVQQLIYSVAQRYFFVLSSHDNLMFMHAEKAAIAEQLKQVQQGHELGVNTRIDVLEAQARHDLVTANLIRGNNALTNARENLSELTDTPIVSVNPLKPAFRANASPFNASEKKWETTAIAHSLTLKIAATALTQAKQSIRLSRSGHLPSLSMTASYQYNETSGGNFGNRATTDSTVGIEFNLPVFQGGRISAQVGEASQRQVQASHEYERQRRQLVRQIHEDVRLWQSSQHMIEAFKQAVVSSEAAVEAAKVGFELGTRTTVDVLDAQRFLFQSKRDYTKSRYDHLLAGLKLRLTSGQLAESDLQNINQYLQ